MEVDRIITGDAVEVMGQMPAESVGMILTSPPYNVGLRYEGYIDRTSPEEHREFSARWMAAAYRVAMDSARMYVVVSDDMLFWMPGVGAESGWQYVQVLTWCKPNIARTGRISNDWNQLTEHILLFRKGARTPMVNDVHGVNTFNWFVEATPQSNYSEGRIHPAQMPLSLCRKLIARTPGAPVLDPFAGSGSVLAAAKKLRRAWIGIELVESVAERARERLRQTEVVWFGKSQQAKFDEAGGAG